MSDRPVCDRCGRTLFGGGTDWRDEHGSPFCYPGTMKPQVHQPVLNRAGQRPGLTVVPGTAAA